MNKNGTVFDLVVIFAVLLVFGIVIVISFSVFSDIKDTLQEQPEFQSGAAGQALESGQALLLNFDYLFAVALVLLTLSLLITSFFIDAHPIFFILSMVALTIFIALAAIMSNVYDEVTTSAELTAARDSFPIMNFFFDNYPFYLLIVGGLAAVVIYAKIRGGGQQQ